MIPAVATGVAFVAVTPVVSLLSLAVELPVIAAVVLGGLALVGAGLLFVPRWVVRGVGMGLLIGWAVMSVVTAGLCTGLNPSLY